MNRNRSVLIDSLYLPVRVRTVNAVITEVDTGKQTITVKDDADENTLGEECLIDCSSTPMVYCDFAAQKVTRISFEELQVNDNLAE